MVTKIELLMENVTPTQILKYEDEWKISEYIKELAAGGYLIKDYFEIAMNDVKYRQVKYLRKATI